MKIAKIFMGNPSNRKGFFNNVVERTKHLINAEPNVDCYIIRVEYGFLLKLIKFQFKKSIYEEYSIIDGIKFKNLWVTMSFFNYLITHRLHKKIVIAENQLNKYIKLFKTYDLLSTHGSEANYLASIVKKELGIPFVATWHGSDINLSPFYNNVVKTKYKELLEAANHNFFVSQKLLETANRISTEAAKSVLYTGPAASFYRYSDDQRQKIRNAYNIYTTYTIGFIGNLVPIKNVLILPKLFKKIQDENQSVSFVIVGDGELKDELSKCFIEQGIKNLYILGKQEPEKIPDIINFLDILVLPSLNEGMPRVTLEAQACGVYVVGSNRGGIPEAISNENCFELDKSFINNAASRILKLLNDEAKSVVLPEKFSWPVAIKKELLVYKNACSK